MLCLGPADGPLVLVAPALFEEANRTRAFTVAIMRGLAARGVASALPDLPGTNESLLPTDQARLADWRAAFAAYPAGRRSFGFAVRGGALIDGEAELVARCHFAPVSGAALIRDLKRARLASVSEGGDRLDPADLKPPGPAVELGGNYLARDLIAELEAAEPSHADRVLRLSSDPLPAERAVEGRALWRSSEPAVDAPLAEAIAEDLAAWVRTCGG